VVEPAFRALFNANDDGCYSLVGLWVIRDGSLLDVSNSLAGILADGADAVISQEVRKLLVVKKVVDGHGVGRCVFCGAFSWLFSGSVRAAAAAGYSRPDL
jgi:hypothetical protein